MSEKSSGLKENAKSRTVDFVRRIQAAKASIEADIEKGDGVYPFNGGRLSIEEFCRRAQIHVVSLHGPLHKTTTLADLRSWLEEVLSKTALGKKAVRRSVTERADEWRQKFMAQANWVHEYHLLEAVRIAEIESAQARIRDLEAENAQLTEAASQGKVIALRRKTAPAT